MSSIWRHDLRFSSGLRFSFVFLGWGFCIFFFRQDCRNLLFLSLPVALWAKLTTRYLWVISISELMLCIRHNKYHCVHFAMQREQRSFWCWLCIPLTYQGWDSNQQPSDHKAYPLTTRPQTALLFLFFFFQIELWFGNEPLTTLPSPPPTPTLLPRS